MVTKNHEKIMKFLNFYETHQEKIMELEINILGARQGGNWNRE